MKNLKQIEFNPSLIGQEGIIIKYRNGYIPTDMRWKVAKECKYPIASEDNTGEIRSHNVSGICLSGRVTDYDLIMYREVKPIEIWVNEYSDYGLSEVNHKSEFDAKIYLQNNARYIRTIKFVEVVELGQVSTLK